MTPSPITPEEVEQLSTQSSILKKRGFEFLEENKRVWEIKRNKTHYQVTFYPAIYDKRPSLRLMTYGESLFEQLLAIIVTEH